MADQLAAAEARHTFAVNMARDITVAFLRHNGGSATLKDLLAYLANCQRDDAIISRATAGLLSEKTIVIDAARIVSLSAPSERA